MLQVPLSKHRKRISCTHFGNLVEARAEALTVTGWTLHLALQAPSAQEAVRQLVETLPEWQAVEVRHQSMAQSA
jgi:hypothetical protein